MTSVYRRPLSFGRLLFRSVPGAGEAARKDSLGPHTTVAYLEARA